MDVKYINVREGSSPSSMFSSTFIIVDVYVFFGKVFVKHIVTIMNNMKFVHYFIIDFRMPLYMLIDWVIVHMYIFDIMNITLDSW